MKKEIITIIIALVLILFLFNSPLTGKAVFSSNLDSGLKLYYDFEGNAEDKANNNDGTVIGAQLENKLIGKSYHFDGLDDYIIFPNALINPVTDNYTLSMIINAETFKGNNNCRARLVTLRHGPANLLNFGFDNSGHLIYAVSSGKSQGTKNTINLSKNTQIIFRKSASYFRIYVNGAKQASVEEYNFSSIIDGPSKLGVTGRPEDNTLCGFYKGYIDEFGIWSRALNDTEVLALYNSYNLNQPSSYCGNGIIQATEACDDNNTNNNDGCSNLCAVESGWNCTLVNGVSSCILKTCTSATEDMSCNDNNLCTEDDVCFEGECKGTPKDCESDLECAIGSCNSATGSCVYNYSACGCTTNSQCASNNPCINLSCVEGFCEEEDYLDVECDDDDPCTEDDFCYDGECIGEEIEDCVENETDTDEDSADDEDEDFEDYSGEGEFEDDSDSVLNADFDSDSFEGEESSSDNQQQKIDKTGHKFLLGVIIFILISVTAVVGFVFFRVYLNEAKKKLIETSNI